MQQAKKQTQMESQQDIVDLTINDDDDCLFSTELGEMVNSLLKMDGTEGNKETAKQNHEDDTLSIYGSEDSEITRDKKGERRRKQENNFQENLAKFQKKAKKSNVQIHCI